MWRWDIIIWDYSSCKILLTIKCQSAVVRCLIKINNSQLASGLDNNNIEVFDYLTGECLVTLKGHSSAIFSLVKINKTQIVSGSADTSIRIWNL